MQQRIVKWYNYLAYGMVDFLGAGSTALTSAWLLFFYTTFCGLTATQGALIFACARFVDAIASPLMGIITDNFHKTKLGRRFGRRKFFILLGIPLVLSYMLFWISGQSFLYYLVTYVTFDVVYTMVLVPYETLASEMTQDYKKRTIFSGLRLFCGQVSAFFAAFIPGRLIALLGKDNPVSFLYASGIFAAVFVIILVFLYLFTWERPLTEIEKKLPTEQVSQTKLSLGEKFHKIYVDLFSTFKIRAFRVHIMMYLGCYISQDIFSQVFTYFIVFALAYTAITASNILSVISIACIIGVVFGIFTISKFNPANIYRISILLFAIGVLGFLGAYLFPGANQMWFLMASGFVSGVGRGALAYIPWNIYSFIPDVDELVTGKRREGIFAGVMTFTRKATQAFAVFLVGVLLDHSGFIATAATQSTHAVRSIVVIMVVGVFFFLVLGTIASFNFKLSKESHALLLDQVSAYKEDPHYQMAPETAKVMKQLTGWDQEHLWGHNDVGFEAKILQRQASLLKKQP